MSQDLLIQLLRHSTLFASMDESDMGQLAESFEQVYHNAGDVLCMEGQPGEALFVVGTGKVKVHKLTGADFEDTLAVLGEGSVVGEVAVLDGEPCSATATVVEPALLFKLSVGAFFRMRLEAQPSLYKFIRNLATVLCSRLREMNQRTRELQADPERIRQAIERHKGRARRPQLTGAGLMSVPSHQLDKTIAKAGRSGAVIERKITSNKKKRTGSTAPLPIIVPDYVPTTGLGRTPAVANFLSQIARLRSFSDDQLSILAGLLREEAYQKGDVICREGDPASDLYIVASGSIDICKRIVGNEAQILATLGAGAMVGEVSLIDGGKRSASCVAHRDDTTILMLSQLDFEALFRDNNPLAFRFIEIIGIDLSLRLRTADDQFAALFAQEEVAPRLIIEQLDTVRRNLDTGEINRNKLLDRIKGLFKK